MTDSYLSYDNYPQQIGPGKPSSLMCQLIAIFLNFYTHILCDKSCLNGRNERILLFCITSGCATPPSRVHERFCVMTKITPAIEITFLFQNSTKTCLESSDYLLNVSRNFGLMLSAF